MYPASPPDGPLIQGQLGMGLYRVEFFHNQGANYLVPLSAGLRKRSALLSPFYCARPGHSPVI